MSITEIIARALSPLACIALLIGIVVGPLVLCLGIGLLFVQPAWGLAALLALAGTRAFLATRRLSS